MPISDEMRGKWLVSLCDHCRREDCLTREAGEWVMVDRADRDGWAERCELYEPEEGGGADA